MRQLLIIITGLQAGMAATALYYVIQLGRKHYNTRYVCRILGIGLAAMTFRFIQIAFTFTLYQGALVWWVVLINFLIPFSLMTAFRIRYKEYENIKNNFPKL